MSPHDFERDDAERRAHDDDIGEILAERAHRCRDEREASR